jgi:hypothetical protein
MKKLLGLVCVGAVVAMMSGCGLINPTSAPTITISAIGSIDKGTYKNVLGKIEASEAITSVHYSVTTATGGAATGITVTGPTSSTTKTQDFTASNPIRIDVAATANGGSYKLVISATAGSTAEASFDFTVGGSTGTPVTETSVTLGAQNATPPSCLDADNMTVYSNTTTDGNVQASIDVIFSYSTVLSPASLAFTSPSVAQGAPYSSWANKAACEYKVVSTTWASITLQSDIDALWGTGAGSVRQAVSQGDIVVIKTSAGVYKAVQITTVNGAAGTATIDIKGKY